MAICITSYKDYFSISSEARAIINAAGANVSIGNISWKTQPASQNTNESYTAYPFTFALSISSNTNGNIALTASYYMMTSGAASSYSVGEAANTTHSLTSIPNIRLLVIDTSEITRYPNMTHSSTHEDYTDSTNGSLMAFLTTHYYETTTPDGYTSSVSTYAKATKYTLGDDVIYNHLINGLIKLIIWQSLSV